MLVFRHERGQRQGFAADGHTTAHALGQLEPRGRLFVEPGTAVYEGMIIGEHSRDNDLEVNPVRAKKLTNVRNTGSEERVSLSPPRCGFLGALGWHCARQISLSEKCSHLSQQS